MAVMEQPAAPAPPLAAGAPARARDTAWLLEQEALALLTRLRQVRPFALQETMLPAAALTPTAQVGIDALLVGGRRLLRRQVLEFLEWLRGPGRSAPPEEAGRRFTLVRMRFNDVLSQFDLFSNVISQRSEHENGVWLAGLDVFAADALSPPGVPYDAPEVICYLQRGPGAAIRRARTRLPGGEQNPVAVVQVPRERMVGHGIGSSLVHEVGHQAAALLDLVPSLRVPLAEAQAAAAPAERAAWSCWRRWVSEAVADVWSVGTLGIGSTLGLIGVVSLPRWFVFRINLDDPHPSAFIRVHLSCAVGAELFGDRPELFGDRQWHQLAGMWDALYPDTELDAERAELFAALRATLTRVARLLCDHRPAALGGRRVRDVLPTKGRDPASLAALARRWGSEPRAYRAVPPSLAFAVLGQARWYGLVTPADESRIVGDLLTFSALRSTLDLTQICSAHTTALARARRAAAR
jgi:hypothetical protein